MSAADYDVVVAGGGPAGSAAATLLARRAHRVALVRPSSPPAPALAESIPPSARRVLEEIGALSAVTAAGFHPNRGNAVWWADGPERREDFSADAEGFHTDRASLERVLVDVAETAGVHRIDGSAVRRAERSAEGWVLTCEGADGEHRLSAPWIVDATGRKGVWAREHREPDRRTTTLALVRRWRRPGGWGDDLAHHTLVESYDEGWAWSVPLSDEVRCLTVMIDQRHAELDAASVDEMLDAELDRTARVGRLRAGCEEDGPAWACPASLYTSRRFAGPGLVLAGDAGSFIDPLSSFGVKKALSSGWLAGIVVHTALVDPSLEETALDFFRSREAEVYRRYRRISADFFAAGADAYGTSYWTERAEAAGHAGASRRRGARGTGAEAAAPRGSPSLGAGRPDPRLARAVHHDPDRLEAEVPEEEVRRAFDVLKARDRLDAVRGSTVRVVERPTIEGHRIVLRDHLASDRVPDGLRFVRGTDLQVVVEMAPRHPEVPDGWAAYNHVAPPVTLPDYLTALSTAFAAGFLEFGEEP